MAAASPIILIIGAGTNVGQHVAKAFIAKGYKVASVSRKAETETNDSQITIQADMSDPSSVEGVFTKVKALLGVPSVVVYNGIPPIPSHNFSTNKNTAAAVTFNDKKNPLTVSLEDFSKTMNVNTTSVFAAAKQAVLGFEKLPETASKTFIFTGNICNELVIAQLVDQGAGKSATAHLINAAALAYQDRGYK